MASSVDGLKRPDFIVIGAPKAGTTSLVNWLRQHPKVFIPFVKEPRFFECAGRTSVVYYGQRIGLPRFATLWDEYLKLFRGAAAGQKIGEATTGYLASPQAPGMIKAYLPNTKLIAVLRNPVERAYSHYLMHLRRGFFNGSFEEELAVDEEKVYPGLRLKQTGNYALHLKRYYSFFRNDQIFVSFFDDLSDNPVSFLKDLCTFLEVDNSFVPNFTVNNEFGYYPYQRYRQWIYESDYEHPARRMIRFFFPARMRRSVHKILDQHQTIPKPSMRLETRQALISYFREGIEQLQDITGRNLSGWMS